MIDNKYGAKFPLLRDMAANGTCDPEFRTELHKILRNHDRMLALVAGLYDDILVVQQIIQEMRG